MLTKRPLFGSSFFLGKLAGFAKPVFRDTYVPSILVFLEASQLLTVVSSL